MARDSSTPDSCIVSKSGSYLLPANATEYPADNRLIAALLPIPVPAPVTAAIRPFNNIVHLLFIKSFVQHNISHQIFKHNQLHLKRIDDQNIIYIDI